MINAIHAPATAFPFTSDVTCTDHIGGRHSVVRADRQARIMCFGVNDLR